MTLLQNPTLRHACIVLAGILRHSQEVMLMCRERNDGCYTALTYLSAKVLEEALVALVQSLVFACIVYFPCEFTGSFGLFWYTYFQTTLIGIREPSPPLLPPHALSSIPTGKGRPPAESAAAKDWLL